MCTAYRNTIDRVQKAIEELEQQVASTSEQCDASARSLRNDVSTSMAALQEQRQQGELAAAELRSTVRDSEAATSQRLDELSAKVEVWHCHVCPVHGLQKQKA